MPKVQFIGQSEQDSGNIAANPSRLINCYLEPVGAGGATSWAVRSVPGATQFCDLSSILGRALVEVNDTLYAASGARLHSIDEAGVSTDLGAIKDDAETILDGYGQNVMVAADGSYYVYDGSTLAEVTGGAFANVGAVTFLSGYTILTEKSGSKFEWTDLQAPKTRNALNVATAEARDDKLRRPMAVGGNLYLFGEKSIEIWYVTGSAGAAAFARLSGGVIDTGLRSKRLIAQVDNAAFFIGDDNTPYIISGASVAPIFHSGVQTSLATNTPTDCHYYEHRGHKFCVIRFSDRPAWIFDLTTKRWHERALGSEHTPWDVAGIAKAYGSWQTINASSVVSKLSETNQDLGATMLRRAVSNTLENGGDPFSPTLEIRARKGFQSSTVDLIAQFSGDGGATWSEPDPRSIGTAGNFDERAVWYEGTYESFTAMIDIAAAEEVPIYADAYVSVA